jgi:hypothetical protein
MGLDSSEGTGLILGGGARGKANYVGVDLSVSDEFGQKL